MKKIFLILIMILLLTNLSAYDKSVFDLKLQSIDNMTLKKASGLKTEYGFMGKNKTEVALLSNGFFTLGTSGGSDEEILDDDCQITFGHPYAMTSYPYFAIDGMSYRPDTYFFGYSQEITANEDTLKLLISDSLKLTMKFEIIQKNEGDTIFINLSLENIDTMSHDLGLGMVFDPALGKWGDGSAFVFDQLIETDTIFQTSIPDTIEIWERKENPKGMGLNLACNNKAPDQIHIGNWFDIYYDQSCSISKIYDLALNMIWDAVSVQAQEEVFYSVVILPQRPDFPNDIFLRADIPYFLSIENNSLFPRTVEPLVELFNNSENDLHDIKLQFVGDRFLNDWNSSDSFTVASENNVYKKALINIPEIYEDRIVTISLNAVKNSQYQDQLFRNIYIPAAPFSDSGLVVNIDTIMYSDFPKVEIIFGSNVESTGQLLTDLGDENIFLYEDESRIRDFMFERDTTGGTNQADIIFVLDVTGSMSDEINGVKNNIVEFTDSLSYRGIDYRLGMVTFLDIIENVYDFTSDVQLFQQYVGNQYAHGGGNYAENSLEALKRATEFDFRPNAKRILIWITDASYHINNTYTQLTQQEVVNEMLAKAIVTHCIGNPSEQTSYYDPIVTPTGGDYFNIYGDFKDILIDISRMYASGKFKITYYSNTDTNVQHEIKLEIHYAGLGGNSTIDFIPGGSSEIPARIPRVECSPNPFNPIVQINIYNPSKSRGVVSIYNILGQKVKDISFRDGQERIKLYWNASDNIHQSVGSGLYIVKTKLYDQDDESSVLPIQKVLYIK